MVVVVVVVLRSITEYVHLVKKRRRHLPYVLGSDSSVLVEGIACCLLLIAVYHGCVEYLVSGLGPW